MASADSRELGREAPTCSRRPLTEKLLIEACLELWDDARRDPGHGRSRADSVVRRRRQGGAGIRLDMNAGRSARRGDPLRVMLSRAGADAHGAQARPEASRGDLRSGARLRMIGEVTDTGHMVLEWNGGVVRGHTPRPLAASALYDAPTSHRPSTRLGRSEAARRSARPAQRSRPKCSS